MAWIIKDDKLVNFDGATSYDLHADVYWYLAPSLTNYSRGQLNVKLSQFGFLLNNAYVNKGIVIALDDLLIGIEPKIMANSNRAIAEETLEQVRQNEFPDLPSRLRCYFLNSKKSVAEIRANNEFRNQNRLLTSCYIILNQGSFHFADIRTYEVLLGQPEHYETAKKYWECSFVPKTESEHQHLEILADSALYFPDWNTFSTIERTALINWQLDHPSTME